MVTSLFFYLFSFIITACAVMVICSRNPVHSVLFLILAFFNSGALFVILGAEFLAMMLVIVYVGAVAVLFLFVVMMLNINFSKIKEGFQKYFPIGSLIGFILFRFFDIFKPFPISYFDKLKNPIGVIGDDILAGLLSGFIIYFIL